MATVFRVKRRSEEEPLQALVLTYKRRKHNDGDVEKDENPSTVVKLSATAKSQEDVSSLIPKYVDRKEDWKSMHQHKVDILNKSRKQSLMSSKNERFKVINCFRHIENIQNDKEILGSKHREVVIFDIESEESKKVKEAEKDEDEDYVYDLYYSQKVHDYSSLDLDITPYLEELDMVFRVVQEKNDDDDDDDDECDEEEDSNDENNWRNDYPDSDNSINEDDMRLAMQMNKVQLGSGSENNDLSSDDEDNDALIYGVEADPFDVEHYGEKYARYKARMQRELSEDDLSNSDEEHSLRSADEDDEDPISRFL